MKNLYHPWNLYIPQKVLYSGKGSSDDQIILHIKTKGVLLALFSERLLFFLLFFFFIKQSDIHTNQHSAEVSNLVIP